MEANAALLVILLSLPPFSGIQERQFGAGGWNVAAYFFQGEFRGIKLFSIIIFAFFLVDANNDNDDDDEGYKSADRSHYDWNYIYFTKATKTMTQKIYI